MAEDLLRVVPAEDNYHVRDGTAQVLGTGDGVTVVASVGDAAALLDAVAAHRLDMVVTDIRMPGTTGRGSAAHVIRERRPDTGGVSLSQHADEAHAFAMPEQGTGGLAHLL